MAPAAKWAPARDKVFVFAACLGPLAWLVWAVFADALGANPIEAITRFLGDWALRFLLLTLTLTPLRRFSGWALVARWRRMIGLFAFTYACLHMLSYVGLDQFFAWSVLWRDLVKRTYITLGMAAFLLLLPLAVTSTNAMIKRLGGARWRRLHLLVHPAAGLAVAHHFLMVKADVAEPLIHGAVLATLWAARPLSRRWAKRRRAEGGRERGRRAA